MSPAEDFNRAGKLFSRGVDDSLLEPGTDGERGRRAGKLVVLTPPAVLTRSVPTEREIRNMAHRRRHVISDCFQITIAERSGFDFRPDVTDISVSRTCDRLIVQVTAR